MKSKRNALRFSCIGKRVKYKTAHEEGEALLFNISSGGCAFEHSSLHLQMEEKVLISIAMPGISKDFQAQGIIVRLENSRTAVRFSLVEPEDLNQMIRYFSGQMRKLRE